jgi:NTP pyrophosphatase (non-canonical NTP hydrolase)
MDFRTAQKLIDENRRAKGCNREVPTELCLLQGELAGLFQAWRLGAPEVGEKLADVVVHALGLAGILGVDLQEEVGDRIRKDAARQYVPSAAKGAPVKTGEGGPAGSSRLP